MSYNGEVSAACWQLLWDELEADSEFASRVPPGFRDKRQYLAPPVVFDGRLVGETPLVAILVSGVAVAPTFSSSNALVVVNISVSVSSTSHYAEECEAVSHAVLKVIAEIVAKADSYKWKNRRFIVSVKTGAIERAVRDKYWVDSVPVNFICAVPASEFIS